MKRYRKSTYSLWRYGQQWYNQIDSFEEAIELIKASLAATGFTYEEVISEIGKGEPLLKQAVLQRAYWFKPNKYQILLKVHKGEMVELDHKFTPVQNKLLSASHTFQGDGLRYNAIEEPSRYRKGGYHHPTVWLAVSAERSKGLTMLPKPKRGNTSGTDYVTAYKVAKLSDHGRLHEPVIWIDTTIRRLKALGLKCSEIYKQLRNTNPSISNRELKRLIGQV